MNIRIFKRLMAGTAMSLFMVATPAMAQSNAELLKELKALKEKVSVLEENIAENEKKTAEKNDPGFKIKWDPAPSISSSDGRFEMNLRGRLFADAAFMTNDVTGDTKTTEFRAARLGIEGKAWNNVKYKFEIDFAGNSVDIKDAYLQLKTGDFKWTFGQHKTANSLDEQTSSRYITFMERAAFTDAFGLARQLGASVGTGGDNWTLSLGAFRGDADGAGSEMDLGSSFAGRLTWGPTLGNTDTNLHLGSSFRYRMVGDDQGLIRYRQRPFVHATSKRFISTDHIASDDLFFGLEAAVVHGRFSVQSEYAWLWAEISPSNDPGFGPTSERAKFTGGYIDASVFLTDDHRSYDPKKGSFGRVKPSKPLFEGGSGAVQFAYRYDMVDLNDVVSLMGGGTTSILGGEQTTHIVGINWYWNNYVRWMFNYSHSKISNSMLEASSLVDINGNNSIDTFSIRAQVDW